MAKICSQKPPLAGGTLNICKFRTSKKALFWHISSILAMKGSQLWPLTHLKDKYYGKIELGKKIVKFGAPGTEIWLFKKKNMDRSIDCAVDHMLTGHKWHVLGSNCLVIFICSCANYNSCSAQNDASSDFLLSLHIFSNIVRHFYIIFSPKWITLDIG